MQMNAVRVRNNKRYSGRNRRIINEINEDSCSTYAEVGQIRRENVVFFSFARSLVL